MIHLGQPRTILDYTQESRRDRLPSQAIIIQPKGQRVGYQHGPAWMQECIEERERVMGYIHPINGPSRYQRVIIDGYLDRQVQQTCEDREHTYRGPEPDQPYGGPEPDQPYRGPESNQAYRSPESNQPYRGPEPDQPYGSPEYQGQAGQVIEPGQPYRGTECRDQVGPSIEPRAQASQGSKPTQAYKGIESRARRAVQGCQVQRPGRPGYKSTQPYESPSPGPSSPANDSAASESES
jgi:hypothetical protein